ncbi:MAG TPA: hypothetical protein VI874_00735 [Candidatus Norongarragalinales archaeon]|nr:hypothetical protein [Candidatus Norongarragalinales archaeon]
MAFEDILFYFDVGKWIILLLIAWWWYNWVREKLAFSPLLTMVVGAVVVYYLAFEYPIIGGLGIAGWMLLTSGILFMLPTFGLVWNTLFPYRPNQQAAGMNRGMMVR